MNIIKELFNYSNGDFSLIEFEKHGVVYYRLSVEGYMGFDNVADIVSLYKNFLSHLEEYLTDNYYPNKTEKHSWKCVYQTRTIEICYHTRSYWVFLDPYESSSIWDTYYFMEDVIDQLEEWDK